MVKVLIAGGAGFIGSTVASACLDAGITPVILDSLVTGRREFTAGRAFYEGEICDGPLVDRIFAEHPDIGAVVQCAARIVVPDSVALPLRSIAPRVRAQPFPPETRELDPDVDQLCRKLWDSFEGCPEL